MASNDVLIIRAGKRALEQMRRSGLNAADVEIIPGAAGGPQGLRISGAHRAIFREWLPSAPRAGPLLGPPPAPSPLPPPRPPNPPPAPPPVPPPPPPPHPP